MKKSVIISLIFFIIAASAILLTIFTAPRFLKSSIEENMRTQNYEKAISSAQSLIRFFPYSEKALHFTLELIPQYDAWFEPLNNKLIISSTMRMVQHSQNSLLPVDTATVKDWALRVAHAQKNRLWRWNIYERLGLFLYQKGDFEQAMHFLQESLDGFLHHNLVYRAQQLYLSMVRICRQTGDIHTAKSLLDSATGLATLSNITEAEIFVELGFLTLDAKNLRDAETYFHKAITLIETEGKEQALEQREHDRPTMIPEIQPAHIKATQGLHQIETLQRPERNAQLQGRLTAMGSGISGAAIFLQAIEEDSDKYGINTSELLSYPHIMTDTKGNFSLQNIPEGTYKPYLAIDPSALIGLGATSIPESITLKAGEESTLNINFPKRLNIVKPEGWTDVAYGEDITIEWTPVAEATQYGVHIVVYLGDSENKQGSSLSWEMDKTDKALYTVNSLSTLGRKPVYSTNSPPEDTAQIPRHWVLGVLHPGATVTFHIKALDDSGSVITDSEGLLFQKEANYPLWTIGDLETACDTTHILDGDRLFLSGQYEKAMEAYRQEMEVLDFSSDFAETSLAALQRWFDRH